MPTLGEIVRYYGDDDNEYAGLISHIEFVDDGKGGERPVYDCTVFGSHGAVVEPGVGEHDQGAEGPAPRTFGSLDSPAGNEPPVPGTDPKSVPKSSTVGGDTPPATSTVGGVVTPAGPPPQDPGPVTPSTSDPSTAASGTVTTPSTQTPEPTGAGTVAPGGGSNASTATSGTTTAGSDSGQSGSSVGVVAGSASPNPASAGTS